MILGRAIPRTRRMLANPTRRRSGRAPCRAPLSATDVVRADHRASVWSLVALVALSACSRLVEIPGPPFPFDPDAEYCLGLGWGSGLEGLETFDLRPDGTVVLVRRHGGAWQQAAAALAAGQLKSVTQAVVSFQVASFNRLYEDPDVLDGEQWVLCLEQGGRRRVVYCNNHFAPGIRAFRDALVAATRAPHLAWTAVTASAMRDHGQALWRANRAEPIAR